MKAIVGAVVSLAGAVLFAGGTVADAVVTGSGKDSQIGYRGMLLGTVVGLVGLLLLTVGWLTERNDCQPPE